MPEQRSPRVIKKGDFVEVDGREDMVRDVSVVLHLASGMDYVVKANETVSHIQPEPLDPDLRAEVAAIDE